MKSYLFSIILILLNLQVFSNSVLDSLKLELANNPDDTTYLIIKAEIGMEAWIMRASYWDSIANECSTMYARNNDEKIRNVIIREQAGSYNNIGYIFKLKGEIDSAIEYYTKAKVIYEQVNDLEGIAQTLNNIGVIQINEGKITEGLDTYKTCLKIREQAKDSIGMGLSYNNIGYVYIHQGDIETGLEYYHKSLKIRELIKNQRAIAQSLSNIGTVHDDQGNLKEALEYYLKSLQIRKELNYKSGISNSLNNIASIYYKKNQLDSALLYYQQALSIREEIQEKESIARSLNTVGHVLIAKDSIKQAIPYLNKSLIIGTELNHTEIIATAHYNLGKGYFALNEYNESEKHSLISFNMSQKLGAPERILYAANNLYQLYKNKGMFDKSLKYYETFITYRDSINNEKIQKATIRQQTKYEFEKVQLLKTQKEKEEIRKLQEATNRRNNLQYSIILVGILAVFGSILALGFLTVRPKIAEGLIFFAFLIFFEFLLVLSDPYIDQFTGGAPAYKLLTNGILAALIFPLHAFFEGSLKQRLVKYKKN